MWSELIKVALLGTDQAELPVSVLAELQSIGIETGGPPEQVLAQGLAYFRLLEKGAGKLTVYEGPVPERLEEEGTTVCSPKSSRHLRLILDGTFAGALPEFIKLLRANNRSLPPESLPDLLDRCMKDQVLWRQLEPALEKLGHWLIRQNPDWQFLAPSADPSEWPAAPVEKRKLILAQWRRTEPKRAVAELEKIWDELPHNEKAAYLKVLETGLSSGDEIFLEKCLDDSRKPVRRQAAQLLKLLPESQWQQRLFEAAAAVVQYGDEQINLNPPAELTKALERDGIESQSSDYSRVSRRLGWFLQMVECIPPARWESHFDREPEAIVAAAHRADKTKNFVRALARAALLDQDRAWLGAIARHWSLEQDEAMWISTLGTEVLATLSDETANRLAIHYLERNEHLLDERSLAHYLLGLGVHDWEDRLALLFVKGFQNWLAGSQTVYGNLWFYKRLLSIASYRCSPELIPKFQTGWYMQSRLWGVWEADVEQFMRVLYFRQEVRDAVML